MGKEKSRGRKMLEVANNLDIAKELVNKYGKEEFSVTERVFVLWQNEELYGDLDLAQELENLFLSLPLSVRFLA